MYRFNIILTEYCNASCTHCYMGNNKSKKSMSKSDIDTIISKFNDDVESVVLTGGEVFLQKDLLFHTIKKIKKHNSKIIVKLESNGSYFYNELAVAEERLKELKKIGVESIRFSLDPFHEDGGIDLNKVKELKNFENDFTPKIEYLVQDKVIGIGKASSLEKKYIEKRKCMNTSKTIDNPYFFVDVNGNVFICTWKCIPPIGNMINEEFDIIIDRLNEEFNKLILQGKILEAISSYNNDYKKNSSFIKKYGECLLCDNTFKRI